jgi:hypothetical protein
MGWQYSSTIVIDDHLKLIDLMTEWADAGWELINGATSTFVTTELMDFMSRQVSHTQYTLFWRREKRP